MVKSKGLQLFACLSFPFMTGMLHTSLHAYLTLSHMPVWKCPYIPFLATFWSTAFITFSPLLLILVRVQKETLQHVHCHVEQPCFQLQKVKAFTWDSFLQIVKNTSVLSLVMRFLNELMVNTTLVLKGHLHHQFLLWVACTQYLLHGWWHIFYFQYEPW